MRDYELTFIIQPDIDDEDRAALIAQVQDWITSLDGQVVKVDNWGMRRFAYNIDKFREGYYVLMHIRVPSDGVRELEGRLQISERIIRYLTVRTEE